MRRCSWGLAPRRAAPCGGAPRVGRATGPSSRLQRAPRYKLNEVIGKGSYGVVCSAIDQYTGEKVAIKKINNVFEHVSDATRILREIKLLRLLKHPGAAQQRRRRRSRQAAQLAGGRALQQPQAPQPGAAGIPSAQPLPPLLADERRRCCTAAAAAPLLLPATLLPLPATLLPLLQPCCCSCCCCNRHCGDQAHHAAAQPARLQRHLRRV